MQNNKQVLHEGKFIRFVKKNNWEYCERINISGIVVIIAITNDEKIILTEQFRPPVNNHVIELPAGLSGDIEGLENEPLIKAAHRELLEETGYHAKTWKMLIQGPPSAGISKEIVTIFKAEGLSKTGTGGGDESENIITHEISLSTAVKWLNEQNKKGKLIDPKVFMGLFFAQKNINNQVK